MKIRIEILDITPLAGPAKIKYQFLKRDGSRDSVAGTLYDYMYINLDCFYANGLINSKKLWIAARNYMRTQGYIAARF